VERSDGRLAPVSYLFGAPSEAAPEDDAASMPADGSAVSPIGDTAGPADGGRTPASGWYIEPGAEAPSSRDDEPAEEGPEPEAPAIAAARRFLSAVEKPSVDRRAVDKPDVDRRAVDRRAVGKPTSLEPGQPGFERATGRVRFVEQADEAEVTAPKPPPVRRASINALARKGMSSAEMTTLLENREIEPDEVAAEVERLEGAGLLDDRVLAHDLVSTLRDRKGLGKSAITAELRRRQVDQAAIDEALENVDVDDELERATEVAIKRAGQLSSYDRTTAERRLSAFLQRRGYSGTVVGAAVKAALGPAGPRFR